jgi:hypothetical protein
MKKVISRFIKRAASDRVGHTLLIAHLCLFIYVFAQKSPVSRTEHNRVIEAGETLSSTILFAGRGFHFHYESPLLKFLLMIDSPALLIEMALGIFLIPLRYFVRLGAYDESWVAAGMFLIATSIQWQLVGYCLNGMFKSIKRGD